MHTNKDFYLVIKCIYWIILIRKILLSTFLFYNSTIYLKRKVIKIKDLVQKKNVHLFYHQILSQCTVEKIQSISYTHCSHRKIIVLFAQTNIKVWKWALPTKHHIYISMYEKSIFFNLKTKTNYVDHSMLTCW